MSRVIYVELDGTLVKSGTLTPIEEVVKRIKVALSNGDEVIVLRTGGFLTQPMADAFSAMSERAFGEILTLVSILDAEEMTEFWSHRVVQLEKDTGRHLVPRKSFGG